MKIYNKHSERRQNLIFTIALINTGFTLLATIISDIYDFIWLRNYNALSVILYLLAAYFAKKEKLNISRLLYLITSNIGIGVVASYAGKPASVEFIYMFNIGLPFILFSFRRERIYVVLFTFLPLLLWTLLFITDFNLFTYRKLDPAISRESVYPLAIISAISLVIFQLIYFLKINSKYFKKISSEKSEAVELSEAKSSFLSTMSHEIRTPLNAVIGLSHILADNSPREDQIQNLEALNYSGKNLLNLLNDVLDYNKMQSTSIELDNIPTNLIIATKQIKKIHEPICLKKGITMHLEVDDTLPKVWLDVVRFNQVLNNLISNAIKFTEKGSITLRIKELKNEENILTLLTEVIDTGIGIPKEKQEKIWEAFSQASSSTNRLYGGTGLGLPIVKNIVNAMGSEVKIDSQENKGSRFYFTIDVKIASTKKIKEEEEEEEEEQDFEEKKNSIENKKILLVEDNPINVMVGKQILEKAKLKVAIANNGKIAVNMMKENDYDIVLMDLQMPVMDGYTATEEIRRFNTQIPILALSASVFSEVKEKIQTSGMNGFIFKPFNPEDLLNEIEKFIEN